MLRHRLQWTLLIGFIASRAFGGFFYSDGETTMHFAFEGNPNGDWPVVRAPGFYHADDGFGFVDSPSLVGIAQAVTAPNYFRFDVNLPDGNYDVTVTLGGANGTSITTVKAEAHRPMLLDVPAGQRQSTVATFTVNVTHGTLEKSEHGLGRLDLDGRLNLEFLGINPALMKLDIAPNTRAVTVYLAGDSTMCDHDETTACGWGQMLPILLKPRGAAVSNQGCSGESIAEANRLKSIASTIKAGDYLLVQFTTGAMLDRAEDHSRFKTFLQGYIDVARKHQATGVLITPMEHSANSVSSDWMRQLAAEQHVPLIDLNASATTFFGKLGPKVTAKAWADDTQLSGWGAYELAKLVALGIQQQHLSLGADFVSGIVSNPDPAKFPPDLLR